MSSANHTKEFAIIAFGNPNSGKEGILKALYQSKETKGGDVAEFDYDSVDGQDLEFTHEGFAIRIHNAGDAKRDNVKRPCPNRDVKAIMFIINVADYDQTLSEESSRNRLQADFDLFDSVANTPGFKEMPIILFLNQVDEFKKKLGSIAMRDFFPDYMDGPDYASDVGYVVKKLVELSPRTNSQIYVHVVDEAQIKMLDFLIEAVKDILEQQAV
jgi:hypothetical protein